MKSQIKVIDIEPQSALAIREEVAITQIPSKMGQFFMELSVHFKKNGIEMTGPPFTLYHDFGKDRIDMEVGFPVSKPQAGEGRVKPCTLPGGRVVTAIHVGPYDKIEKTYGQMQQWMSEKGFRPKNMMWEKYLNDPQTVKDPEQYVTELFWPIE
jgi:effector-binding domain-containing protein